MTMKFNNNQKFLEEELINKGRSSSNNNINTNSNLNVKCENEYKLKKVKFYKIK